ncbi:MAG: hypothetical protein ACK40O_09655, partial [Allosphingosinicella sp.]
MTTFPRRSALSCALLATAALSVQASAQDKVLSPPPEKFAIAPGGVDMRSGRYVYEHTDLTIGAEGGALTLTRTLAQPVWGHTNPFGNFSHNWDILLVEKRVNITENEFKHHAGRPDYQMEVVFGGRTEAFRAYGSAGYGFDQTSRSGYATLSYSGDKATSAVYTYKTGDGTVAVFRPINSGDCSIHLRCAYVSSVTHADGTRFAFTYDTAGGANSTRLRRVTSNRGYALHFDYSGAFVTRSCVFNIAQAPPPTAGSCPAGMQARAAYSYVTVTTASGAKTRLATMIDPTNATWQFANSPGSIGFHRPGESTPWLTNTFVERMNPDELIEEIVSSQSFADGSSYSYQWDETPFVPHVIPSIAGGSFTDQDGHTTTLEYGFPQVYRPTGGYGDVDENGGLTAIVWQVTPGPIKITDPLGRITLNDYCDPAAMGCAVTPMPVSTTDPEGIKTVMNWDYSVRVLLATTQVAKAGALPAIVQSATYNCTPATIAHCTKPTQITDAKGNKTDYSWSAAHGGLLKVQLPAVTPGVAGAAAVRPETRHEYVQRYAWISNGAGGWTQAATPVWLLSATSTCPNSASTGNPSSPCAIAGDEVRTVYDYG